MAARLIAIVLYPGLTALDAIGPYECLRFLPDTEVRFVAERAGDVPTDCAALSLPAPWTYHDVPRPDVVVVPGGPGTAGALHTPLIPWLKQVHPNTCWTTSVCSGSLLLGAAGLLPGLLATSHFAVADRLAAFGATPVNQRVVEQSQAHIITAAGVSSGLDMALRLGELLSDRTTAEAIQLLLEYAPEPPFGTGSLPVSQEVVRLAVDLGTPQGAIPPGWAPP